MNRILGIDLKTVVLFVCAFVIVGAASGSMVAQTSMSGTASDPLAELEAWNKIKESSVAADYHSFLQKFPNGSLAARARERMNTLGDPVWNELKKSNDPFKYRDYIKANPNSPFLDQAKAQLEILTPAAVEWEKVKAVGDLQSVMRFIAASPAGPYAADAKTMIEPELWRKISTSETDDLLEFYSRHYSDTERGKEAGLKLKRLKSAKRELEFQGIRSRLTAFNGVQFNRVQSGGTTGATMWYENKIVDLCTLKTTANEMSTLHPLMYSSESYRIDFTTGRPISIGSIFPGSTSVFVAFGGSIFSGIGRNYSRKSASNPFVQFSSYPTRGSSAVALTTPDSGAAARFADDLKKLAGLCKASK